MTLDSAPEPDPDPDSDHVTLRHAVDLLQLTARQVQNLGQEQDLQMMIPTLIDRVTRLELILEELGADARRILGKDKRLGRLLQHVGVWKAQLEPKTPPPQDQLLFELHASPLLSQAGFLRVISRKLLKDGTPILLTLCDGELGMKAGDWGMAVPARFEQRGLHLVRPIFLKVLLDYLQETEWISCRITADSYGINSWSGTWPPL